MAPMSGEQRQLLNGLHPQGPGGFGVGTGLDLGPCVLWWGPRRGGRHVLALSMQPALSGPGGHIEGLDLPDGAGQWVQTP